MKQVLDIKQMLHLQELGLGQNNDTMLSWIVDEREKDKPLLCASLDAIDYVDFSHYCIPAYTLQDVIELLPPVLKSDERILWLRIDLADECIYYYDEDSILVECRRKVIGYNGMDELLDATYKLLIWCVKQGYVKTNKEEQK